MQLASLHFIFIVLLFYVVGNINFVFANNHPVNDSDIYISEDVGNNGRRYFIQYRRLGDTDTYVNVRRRVVNNENVKRYMYGEDEDGRDNSPNLHHPPANFQLAKERFRENMASKVLDPEWNYDMNKSYYEVPELAHELYKLMEKNDKKMINNATVIKCLFQLPYKWLDNDTFEFDMTSIQEDVNQDDLEVVDAELHVYRIQEHDDDDSSEEQDEKQSKDKKDNKDSNKNDKNKNKKGEYLVRLYQRMPVDADAKENATLLDLHKLLSVRYISSTYEGWQTFKVKGALDGWFSGELNLGLILNSKDMSNNDVYVPYADKDYKDGQYAPILTVYLKNSVENSTLHDFITVNNDDKGKEEKVLSRRKIAPLNQAMSRLINGKIPCSRHIFYVNFEEIRWNNFVLAPKGYMAYRCKGSCTIPSLSDHSNHGRIMRLYEELADGSVLGPRCSPTAFKPLTMMFYDKQQNIVIKKYEDMIVEKCGCR